MIGEGGEQMGIVSSEEALRIAEEHGLDLVKISPQATPPVCKLMNYGKYKFEQSKREKEAKKNQHVVEIKEIRMSPGIDVGDFNTKLKTPRSSCPTATASRYPSASAAVRWRTPTLAAIFSISLQTCVPKWRPSTRLPSWRDGICRSSCPPRLASNRNFPKAIILEGEILCLN